MRIAEKIFLWVTVICCLLAGWVMVDVAMSTMRSHRVEFATASACYAIGLALVPYILSKAFRNLRQ